MTTTAKSTYPDWIDSLTSLIEDLRRLDIRIDNDTRLEPAPAGGDDQVNSAILSRTRITSQGRLVAEFEYSGRIRLWHQWHQTMASAAQLAATNGQATADSSAPSAPTAPTVSQSHDPANQGNAGAPQSLDL
jgi:hypothetical protein